MDDVMVIAQNTASRVLRMKALYFLLAIVICIIASGQLYGDITVGREKEYSLDLGFAMTMIVGVLCALVTCFDLPRELREKTMVAVLSKPLGRDRYLIGKFLGVCEITLISMAIVGVGMLVLTAMAGQFRPNLEIIKALILVYCAVVQLAAVGIVLGTFLKEWLATLLALVTFWGSYALGYVAANTTSTILQKIIYLLPNFAIMGSDNVVARGGIIEWRLVGGGVLLTAVYSLIMLIVAGLIFRRKDIA
ncbi:MAG: ABC transporter permease subunit [Phycisphaerae bacterium]|nr:ABC transporter permease subunit [Phycisphaerae bacterium]